MILAIDTATSVCSVAISDQGVLLDSRKTTGKNEHSSALTLLIKELTSSTGYSLSALDAIAVSSGPGSYTGLRIGVATAKGLCYALNRPLIAIPTLQSMASGMREKTHPQISFPEAEETPPKIFCPMIDARRMEVFCGLFNYAGIEIKPVRAEIINENSFHKELEDNIVVFAGDGAEKCKPFLSGRKNSVFIDNFTLSAKFMIPLAEYKFANRLFEDLAYFEPFYLKEFIAGKPRVKGLD